MLGTTFTWILLGNLPQVAAQFRPGDPGFFEDGEEQFNREIERLNDDREDDSTLLTIDESTSEWLQVTSTEGRFAVAMPGTPTVAPNPEILATPAANLELMGVTLEHQGDGFLVAYADYPDGVDLNESDVLLSQVRDAFVAGIGGELLDDRQLSDRAGPGREFRVSTPEIFTTFRAYLIDRRLYILGVQQTEPMSEDDDFNPFFESFEPGIPEER
ncbi:MAG: hypothetical protein SWY16_24730 [Cyanobacteriota bacterium]|nr:hypothetical protein [Cyanobacteriota bacterium]